MTMESFAATWRLKIRLDECGDKIISGKRGHLYCDEGRLCLMVVEGARAADRGNHPRARAARRSLRSEPERPCQKGYRLTQDSVTLISGVKL